MKRIPGTNRKKAVEVFFACAAIPVFDVI